MVASGGNTGCTTIRKERAGNGLFLVPAATVRLSHTKLQGRSAIDNLVGVV